MAETGFFPTGKDKINICVVIHILLSQFLNTIASLQILKAGTYNDDLYLITTSAHEYKWNIFLTCSDTAAAKTERKSFLTRQAYYISNFFAWFHMLNYNWLLLLFMHYYMTRCSSGWPVQRPTVPAFSCTCSPYDQVHQTAIASIWVLWVSEWRAWMKTSGSDSLIAYVCVLRLPNFLPLSPSSIALAGQFLL